MESELELLRRANAELQAWVRDLLEENRYLRRQIAEYGEARSDPAPPSRLEGPARPAAYS